jgi:hypothetical protein
MAIKQPAQAEGFSLLNQEAQQRLRARVAAADIASVRRDISAQLEALDRGMTERPEDVQRSQQADRAFLVAQLAYLDMLEHATFEHTQPQKRGLLERLRSAFGRERVVE